MVAGGGVAGAGWAAGAGLTGAGAGVAVAGAAAVVGAPLVSAGLAFWASTVCGGFAAGRASGTIGGRAAIASERGCARAPAAPRCAVDEGVAT